MCAIATMVWHHISARLHARLSADDLRSYQDGRARRVIARAIARSAFYRRHLGGLDLDRWRELPTVDKATMMDNFDAFVTRRVSREAAMNVALEAERRRDYRPTIDDLTVGLSSGTSGHRGLFVVDRWERAVWAGRLLAWVLPNPRLRGYKVALLLRSGSNLYDTVRSRWIDLRYGDLMTPVAASVASLNEFQPDILVAPPSLLAMLAEERSAGRLHASPAKVISVAEVLDHEDQARIANAFGGPVHQLYQCTEGLLAATCREGVLHVLEDAVALQYEPVQDGSGIRVTPVVTDLWRRIQPIIRYRLNDILVLGSAQCACGSSFQQIARIEGRQDDVLYFERREGGLRPFFPDVMRRAVLLASPDIVDYEVVQWQVGAARLHFTSKNGTSPDTVARALRNSVEQILAQYGCAASQLEVVPWLPARQPHEKRRRVRRTTS